MLVIKVELHSAVTGEVTVIEQMVIYNNGRAGHYDHPYAFDYVGHTNYKGPGTPTKALGAKTGEVSNYPQRDERTREFTPVWFLIAKMLKAMGYSDGNPG